MKSSFQRVYAVQEVGLRAVRPGLFTSCSAAVKRLAKPKLAVFCLLRYLWLWKGMLLLRMACVEPCSEATKTLAVLLTVKPSKILRFKNTGVLPFIREVSWVLRKCISYVFTFNTRTIKAITLKPVLTTTRGQRPPTLNDRYSRSRTRSL